MWCCSDPSPDDTAEIPDNLPFTHYYEEGEDGISLDQRWKEHWRPRPVWNNLHTNSPQVITELPDVKYLPDTVRFLLFILLCCI
jgi:hypothetical protein